MTGNGQKRLELVGIGWKWLEIAVNSREMAENGRQWLEMAEFGWKWVEMDCNELNLLNITGNGWKRLVIAGNG